MEDHFQIGSLLLESLAALNDIRERLGTNPENDDLVGRY